MDNKKLMQLLLRDVKELDQILTGMKVTGESDPYEIELLSTRMSGVRHMLEMIAAQEGHPARTETVRQPVKSGKLHEAGDEHFSGEKDAPDRDVREPVAHPVPEPPACVKPDIPEERGLAKETVPPVEPFPQPEEPVLTEPVVTVAGKNDEEMTLMEEEVVSGAQTLGEKFVHGRSVNDLLLEKGKTDYKFSHMPLPSLQAAIGINDRFLFTRELFEGNGDSFTETVRKLDAFATIHEAAQYLRENFKWKKNETSLKFIDLVKRRFA